MCQSCGSAPVVWMPSLGTTSCWCESSCNECQQGCGWCNFPNLVWGNCITIDKTNPDNWIFNTECNPIVKSTDSTVWVTVTTNWNHKEYDLSVKCQDKKVWVQSCDTNPWYLNDKIFVESPLVKDVDCDKITLSLDTNALWIDIPDEKVKVDATCSSKYLSDSISVWKWLKVSVENCKVKIDIDCDSDDCTNCWKKPAMKVRLVATEYILQPNSQEKYYILASTQNWMWTTWFLNSEYLPEVEYWCIDYNEWWIEFKKPWIYAVWFGGNQEVSWWVNGSRVWLVKYDSITSTWLFIAESRYSWWSDWTTRPVPAHSSNNTDVTANGAMWLNFGLWKYLERLPVWQWTICYFVPWDKITLWVKLSTRVEDPEYTDASWKFALLWSLEWFAWWDSWAYFYAYSISDFCDCWETAQIC